MAKIEVSLDSAMLKRLVIEKLRELLGNVSLDEKNVKILVKTKHNYKAEWEDGDFKAEYSKTF